VITIFYKLQTKHRTLYVYLFYNVVFSQSDISCYKMTNFKSLTVWTIVLNFFIIVGAGHGMLCIGLLEIFSIVGVMTGHNINDDYFSLSLTVSYDKSLGAVALFSLVGQMLLIISFFIKGQKYFWTKLLGLFFLWIGFYYLTHNIFNDSLSQVGFFVGIPFLISSGLLTYKMTKEFQMLDTE
jgi:hypothetical protein